MLITSVATHLLVSVALISCRSLSAVADRSHCFPDLRLMMGCGVSTAAVPEQEEMARAAEEQAQAKEETMRQRAETNDDELGLTTQALLDKCIESLLDSCSTDGDHQQDTSLWEQLAVKLQECRQVSLKFGDAEQQSVDVFSSSVLPQLGKVEHLELDLAVEQLVEVGQLDVLEGADKPLDDARASASIQEHLLREVELRLGAHARFLVG